MVSSAFGWCLMSSLAVYCKTKFAQAGESLAPKMCRWYSYSFNSGLFCCLHMNRRYCQSCFRFPICINIASMSPWRAMFPCRSRSKIPSIFPRRSGPAKVCLGWQDHFVACTNLYSSDNGKLRLQCSPILGLLECSHCIYCTVQVSFLVYWQDGSGDSNLATCCLANSCGLSREVSFHIVYLLISRMLS